MLVWSLGQPWERKWQPTTLFLPGESHGQGSLMACRPWDYKELDTTEQVSMSTRPRHGPESLAHGLRGPVQSLEQSQNLKDTAIKKGHELFQEKCKKNKLFPKGLYEIKVDITKSAEDGESWTRDSALCTWFRVAKVFSIFIPPMKISYTEQIVKLPSNPIFFWTVLVVEKMILWVLTLIFNVKTSYIKKYIYVYTYYIKKCILNIWVVRINSLPFSNVPFLILKLHWDVYTNQQLLQFLFLIFSFNIL